MDLLDERPLEKSVFQIFLTVLRMTMVHRLYDIDFIASLFPVKFLPRNNSFTVNKIILFASQYEAKLINRKHWIYLNQE